MQVHKNLTGNKRGIALFMVLSAMSILSILVTEFSYVSQLNSRIAYNSLDQIKALYLAKSALKLSLLRLKAYQNLKGALGGGGGVGAQAVPKQILEQIWSFPLIYPIPVDLPGLSPAQKEAIRKFQKETELEGNFSALIQSESSRYNLNTLLPPLAAASPQPSPSATPAPSASPSASPRASANPAPTPGPGGETTAFNAETARKSLADYLWKILDQKFQADPDFATEYRDFKLEDLMENIIGWVDRTYEPKETGVKKEIKRKRAPFYSMSELHLIHPMDDALFNLFSPSLTASPTGGINVNTLQEASLNALVPQMTKEEVKEFFKFRDSQEADNQFKTDTDFFNYLQDKVSSFHKDPNEIKKFKDELSSRGIKLLTEENHFKISIQAKVNQSTKRLEAWVTLTEAQSKPSPGASPVPAAPPVLGVTQKNDPGLKITFLKIL